ncbi:hypothetical protein C8R43DRAFT_1130461 [Mycena crocata]|nr:hypothetical protein C8R43DRAFT_1130461 [Mycena crocata]
MHDVRLRAWGEGRGKVCDLNAGARPANRLERDPTQDTLPAHAQRAAKAKAPACLGAGNIAALGSLIAADIICTSSALVAHDTPKGTQRACRTTHVSGSKRTLQATSGAHDSRDLERGECTADSGCTACTLGTSAYAGRAEDGGRRDGVWDGGGARFGKWRRDSTGSGREIEDLTLSGSVLRLRTGCVP